jgi:hypothetical protein
MKRVNILIIIQLIARVGFAQLDSDFINAKRAADNCFQTQNYACAKKQYEIALAIKENDVYCKERIELINKKEIQLKKNKEEKVKYQAAQRNSTTKNKPYYGTLKALYDENNEKFEYTGYIQNGQPEGHGIANYNAYDKYLGKEEGEWHDGKKQGKFKANYPNGDTYEAEYKDGLLDGRFTSTLVERNEKEEFFYKKGKMYGLQKTFTNNGRIEILSINGEFEGQLTGYGNNGEVMSGYYKNGGIIGEVSVINKEGNRVVGYFKNRGFNGTVKIYFANEDKFEGNFINNSASGMGKLIYKNGDVLEGNFDRDVDNIKGNATISFINGDKYVGEYSGGAENGKGKISYSDGGIYDGHWLNGLWDGYGTYTTGQNYTIMNCPKCVTYVGWFLNSLKHGNGKCYGINGELIYNGKFENNKPIDKYPSKVKK